MWPPRISDSHFKGCLEEATACLSPQFLFYPFWLPPVSSRALFPVTISWWFCSPYLPSSDPESTDLSAVACAELRALWGLPLPVWLLRARDDEYLVLSEELFTPAPLLPPTPCAPATGPDLDIVVRELLLACFSPGLPQHSATPQVPHSSPVGTYQVPLAKWLYVQYFQHPRIWGWGRLF